MSSRPGAQPLIKPRKFEIVTLFLPVEVVNEKRNSSGDLRLWRRGQRAWLRALYTVATKRSWVRTPQGVRDFFLEVEVDGWRWTGGGGGGGGGGREGSKVFARSLSLLFHFFPSSLPSLAQLSAGALFFRSLLFSSLGGGSLPSALQLDSRRWSASPGRSAAASDRNRRRRCRRQRSHRHQLLLLHSPPPPPPLPSPRCMLRPDTSPCA
jgi:hypothetical protein